MEDHTESLPASCFQPFSLYRTLSLGKEGLGTTWDLWRLSLHLSSRRSRLSPPPTTQSRSLQPWVLPKIRVWWTGGSGVEMSGKE